MEPRQWFVGSLGPLVFVAGCEAILGIEDGKLRTFCSGKPEGTPLPGEQQKPADCLDLVCDGQGQVKQNPAPSDNDDGNPCTKDSCNGVMPVHEKLKQGPCYSGPSGTENVGTCEGGFQQCDEGGNAIGTCMGETLPAKSDGCDVKNGVDDDCDGEIDDDCYCGDGVLTPEIGEECDDGGTADGDLCSPTCKEQRVLAIRAGYFHTCAILSGGIVKCWGLNGGGQLGLGDLNNRGDQPEEMGHMLPPVDLGLKRRASSLASSGEHVCAILDDRTVKCWGANYYGQVGLGNSSNWGDDPGEMGEALPVVSLGSLQKPLSIAAGSGHSCALFDDGPVKCWGRNDAGQLGLGDVEHRGDGPNEMGTSLPFVDLGGGEAPLSISAGYAFTCALFADEAVKCWGVNDAGQLGLGNTTIHGDNPAEMGAALAPVWLGSNQTATAISSGYRQTCALLNNGSSKCWGWNLYAQLGLGDTDNRGDGPGEMGDALLPINLGTNVTLKQISAGGDHSCALFDDGRVKCWGAGGYLGLGDTITHGDKPGTMGDALMFVELGRPAMAITAGMSHTCALLTNGTVKCWGRNNYGQLGLGDTNTRGDELGEMGDNLPTVKLFSDKW